MTLQLKHFASVLLPLLVLLLGCTPAEEWHTPNGWLLEDSTLWAVDNGHLELLENRPHGSDIRRPGAVATVGGTESLESFQVLGQVQSTQDSLVVGRDVILVFGYRSPRQFYYAHLSNDNTVMPHNGIFLVDNADRRRIDEPGLARPPEARLVDSSWHDFALRRDALSGSIRVFFDDLNEPLMVANDTTLRAGSLGFGSFDDTGAARHFRWKPTLPDDK